MPSRHLLALCACVLLAPVARAEAPPFTIGHQGRLTQANDELVEGPVTLRFALYDVARNPEGGSPVAPLWSAEYSTVATKGLYAVRLGDVSSSQPALPPTLFDGTKVLWLGISVGAGQELSPRLAVAYTPLAVFASRAGDADKVGGQSLAQLDTRYAAKAGGPGLDADTLDGIDAADFARAASLTTALGTLGSAAGTINADTNPIHWSQLKGVPDSIKDGAITSVATASPLKGSGTAASPLALDAAGADANGYLKKEDFARFDAKASATDPRFTDARDPKAGSTHYVQNGTSAQAGASFNVGGTGRVGGDLTVGGKLTAGVIEAAEVPAGAENLIPNPDLRRGERGWESTGGYTGFTVVRTLKDDPTAPVASSRKIEIKVTTIGSIGDAHPIAFRIPRVALNTDYNMSCWVRAPTGTAVRGHFNVEGHELDWSARVDAPNINWNYVANGTWQRVSGTFNTGAKPAYLIYARGFDAFGTWDVTGCQLTRGKTLAAFTVTYPDMHCPNDSLEKYNVCIQHLGGAYDKTQTQAAAACKARGMRLCSMAEMWTAWQHGAQWCSWGWLADRTASDRGLMSYPMQGVTSSGCGTSAYPNVSNEAITALASANCCL